MIQKVDKYLLALMTMHTALLVASNAAGSKIIALPFGLAASATVLSYMLTFVILDSIAELYGRECSRFVINVGLVAMALSVLFFELSIALPPAPFWSSQDAYRTVLGSSWRIMLGGWTAYLISQHLDLLSYFTIRNTKLGGRYLWLRAWLSILIGQLIDTVIFITVAFYGDIPLFSAMAGQYLIKVVIASVMTPLVSLAVTIGRRFMANGGHKSCKCHVKR